MANENYANARTLATIEHMGESFRVCRRRINGKPWRKYLALVHGDTFVAGMDWTRVDVPEAVTEFERMLGKTFATRESLLESLGPIKLRHAPVIEAISLHTPAGV